jgi:hypothetical protein
MIKFKIKHTIVVKILLAVVFFVCVLGCAWNIFNLINAQNLFLTQKIAYILLAILTLVMAIIAFALFFFSSYRINRQYLYTNFGIISTKFSIESITAIVHFKKSDKLVLYFTDQKYSVLLLSPTQFDSFIDAIKSANPNICYNVDYEDDVK